MRGVRSVRYVSSENLRYQETDGGRMIHSSYQRWVGNLARAINAKLSESQL